MKTLLFLLVLTSLTAWGQQPASASNPPVAGMATGEEIVKRANVITLHTADSANVAYTKLARLLLAEGYVLDKADRELGFVNTGYHHSANRAVEVALRVVVVPNPAGALVEVRGVSRMPGMSHTLVGGDSPIEYRGMSGSPAMLAWEAMARLAATYHAPQTTCKRQL